MSDSELYYDHPDEHLEHQNPPAPAPGARQPSYGRGGDRPNMPTRSSTVSSPHDFDRKRSPPESMPHARSEDLNHGAARRERNYDTLDRPQAPSGSRPTSPVGASGLRNQPPWATSASTDASHRLSVVSATSIPISRSSSSDTAAFGGPQSSTTSITSTANSTWVASFLPSHDPCA